MKTLIHHHNLGHRFCCSASPLVVAASLLLVAACGSDDGEADGKCVPGHTTGCACAGGGSGVQTCLPEFIYGDCACDPSDPQNTTSDAGVHPPRTDGGTAVPPGAKRMFVTSTTYRGDFGGLTAADEACAALAAGALLGGKWKAWLSSKGYDTVNAIDRIADVGPWYRLDGVKLFNNKAQLSGTPLDTPDMDEKGNPAGGRVWTGTANGGKAAGTCDHWSVSDIYTAGTAGYASVVALWNDDGDQHLCEQNNRLYCLEQ